jgi:hypothetical protein
MKATTIRSLAVQIGVSYWAIRHAVRQGYVSVERPYKRRKLYLQPEEVDAIKKHFGVLPAKAAEDRRRGFVGQADRS